MSSLKEELQNMRQEIKDLHTVLINPAEPQKGFVVRLVIAEKQMQDHYIADKKDFRFIKWALIILAIAIGNLICGNPVMAQLEPILKFMGF